MQAILGVGLSHESAHPVEVECHLREAVRSLDQHAEYSGPITLPVINFELASVMGQQGRTAEAITLYHKVLEQVGQGKGMLDLIRSILIYNNLA